MLVKSFARKACLVLTSFLLLYVVHGVLRQQHYQYCKSNIIRVLLLQNSDMCMAMERFLSLIESVCSQEMLKLLSAKSKSVHDFGFIDRFLTLTI